MFVTKRNLRNSEQFNENKIYERLNKLAQKPKKLNIDVTRVVEGTTQGVFNSIETRQIDKLSAQVAESLKLEHLDYSILASRILVSNNHKNTPSSFAASTAMNTFVRDDIKEFVAKNAKELDAMINHELDYKFNYFGFTIMERQYMNLTYDRPQYVFMRVAICINRSDFNVIRKLYLDMANHLYTHATATLMNACKSSEQLNSCFLLEVKDSIKDIYKTLNRTADISKDAGGIGMCFSPIRASGSTISSTGGTTRGIVPFVKLFESSSLAVDQGGRRKGSTAIYLELWHGDILAFLQLKRNTGGAESERARGLYYGVWVPDLFMKRYLAGEHWSLFSEHTAPGLSQVFDGMFICKHCQAKMGGPDCEHGHVFEQRDMFTELYEEYEAKGLACDTIPAKDIIDAICQTQQQSGMPYVCFKDHVNRQSNQMNAGTVTCSNLCTEIMEVCNSDSYASCTLASINLSNFVQDGQFNYTHLEEIVAQIVRSLDIVVDINKYPVPECIDNANSLRPIGLGVQGLADVFCKLRLPFLSQEAESLDIHIFECIYYAALKESVSIAKKRGKYSRFDGSPASNGLLSQDLWLLNQEKYAPAKLELPQTYHTKEEWNQLRADIYEYGLRHSLHIALMPTSNTSQLFGSNESFEPFSANIISKSVAAGVFMVVNQYMFEHLYSLNLWDPSAIIDNGGSLDGIVPAEIAEIYKNTRELSQAALMRRSSLRQAYIDQAQSMNIYLKENSMQTLRGVISTGWKLGMKTGSYYIHTSAAADPIKTNLNAKNKQEIAGPICTMSEGCISCSS